MIGFMGAPASRILVLSASRLALYSVPSFRSVGVGSALVLERAARAGWRGALADLGRVGVGACWAVCCGRVPCGQSPARKVAPSLPGMPVETLCLSLPFVFSPVAIRKRPLCLPL